MSVEIPDQIAPTMHENQAGTAIRHTRGRVEPRRARIFGTGQKKILNGCEIRSRNIEIGRSPLQGTAHMGRGLAGAERIFQAEASERECPGRFGHVPALGGTGPRGKGATRPRVENSPAASVEQRSGSALAGPLSVRRASAG